MDHSAAVNKSSSCSPDQGPAEDEKFVQLPSISNAKGKESDDDETSHHTTKERKTAEDSAEARRLDHPTSPVPPQSEGATFRTEGGDRLLGNDIADLRFRILKIDRTSDSGELNISQDDTIYSKAEMNHLLNTVDDGNRGAGGLRLRCTMWGLLGFIRFTGAFYMLLVTKRNSVAMIGGHYIYQIDGTELISLTSSSSSRFKLDRNPEETRFVGILNNLDLTKSFYFSYSYDVTRTLQHNILRERKGLSPQSKIKIGEDFNEMFVWNDYLLEPVLKTLNNPYDWCLRIVHGYVDQASMSKPFERESKEDKTHIEVPAISVYSRSIVVTVIARRSRYFAGARFLKRGANDLGYVANDVETEQIVSDLGPTSFHAPGPRLFRNPNYTSYVQHRGSIPLFWTQDNTGANPKPPIELQVDPFFSAAALHFDNLFERYGAPIYALNLVKSRERVPRESKLLKEYTSAIKYLNQSLPNDKKIMYKAWDMSRASKRFETHKLDKKSILNYCSRDQDVIRTLENIAEEIVKNTGFFKSGDSENSGGSMQNGVARTNCVDCLDRTNAAQFIIGKCALGYQLHALGIIEDPSVDYDTDAVNLFSHMYHDHGDTIAIQYGGSHLVNTMETYRKINQWTSHSRDMVESFKRYYNNSFLDGQRQEAYNLFLGNYIFAQGQPMIWDLSTDYYLHHADPRAWAQRLQRSYVHWYSPEFLAKRTLPELEVSSVALPSDSVPRYYDDFWVEYYRPLSLSSLYKLFAYRMNSTLKFMPVKATQEGNYDWSPFKVRANSENEISEKKRARKGVTILAPYDLTKDETNPHPSRSDSAENRESVSNSGNTQMSEKNGAIHGIMKDAGAEREQPALTRFENKNDRCDFAFWSLDQSPSISLEPTVARSEAEEYRRYLNHSLDLPLVLSTDTPPSSYGEYLNYIEAVSVDGLFPSITAEDESTFRRYLDVKENPLTVTGADAPMKRYKAYKRWLKGKPLFK
ncbi:MAG: phosphatidylinositol-3,5-bisphosphate 5-phosphatase [Vezdaea aestivalis]|nr:MAG: phosphatidylinositol-3,5-bisphosphate 5-phosphatase [Vezdaea aestivalis]